MTYTRANRGTCSVQTTVTIEDGIIKDVQILGGCDGNLKGIRQLLIGMDAADAADRMEGTLCGRKSTSCPDQIAKCIREALAQ